MGKYYNIICSVGSSITEVVIRVRKMRRRKRQRQTKFNSCREKHEAQPNRIQTS